MEQKMEDAFEYAIEKGNIELFDVLNMLQSEK